MDTHQLHDLLKQVADGTCSPDKAAATIEGFETLDLGYARLDVGRKQRTGVAEVIYGEGKSAEQIAGIAQALYENEQQPILITRLSEDKIDAIREQLAPDVVLEYHSICQVAHIGNLPEPTGKGSIVIAAAGTSDLPVAEEAAVVAEVLGNRVHRLFDVGVAGIHRLLSHEQEIQDATVVIVVAGMEGALASVVAGLTSAPVIAVPTSVGYGASFGGVAALLAMLNSCASGVSVVNIDNGFGAAFQASLINHIDA